MNLENGNSHENEPPNSSSLSSDQSYNNIKMILNEFTDIIDDENSNNLKGRDVFLTDALNTEIDDNFLLSFKNNEKLLLNANNMKMNSKNKEKDKGKYSRTKITDIKAPSPSPPSYCIKYLNRNGKYTKTWECGICLRNFQHQYILIRHLPIHTNIRNFICNECGKRFRQLSTLSQHKAIHSIDRPYSCEKCNKSFNRVSTLISHRKTHSDVKPFRCHMCNKGFHQKGNLRNHIYIHTNERPYRCTFCNKGFNQMSNLVCHTQKSHSNESNAAVWTCHSCNMNFTKRTLLRAHELQTHHIQSSTMKNPRNEKSKKLPKINKKNYDDHNHDCDDDDLPLTDLSKTKNIVICRNSHISDNGILISSIKTEAMIYAKRNHEIPFAVLHFIEGLPLLVRIIDYSNTQSLLRPANHEDFNLLKQKYIKKLDKISISIVATVYQKLIENGNYEFNIMPPKDIYKFMNEKEILLNYNNNLDIKFPENDPEEEIGNCQSKEIHHEDDEDTFPKSIIDSKLDLSLIKCEFPTFNNYTRIKTEDFVFNENSNISYLNEYPKVITIIENSNNDDKSVINKNLMKYEMFNENEIEFSAETFQNIATGNLLTPKKITENDILPEENSSILDISSSGCFYNNLNNNKNQFELNSDLANDYLTNFLNVFKKDDFINMNTIRNVLMNVEMSTK